ncbi:LITAF-like zinc ribbon domain-containing protein [Microdochium nivale]|nr:LITAF-like zinc ribbon domain-containing protein [Microdochium nivale]
MSSLPPLAADPRNHNTNHINSTSSNPDTMLPLSHDTPQQQQQQKQRYEEAADAQTSSSATDLAALRADVRPQTVDCPSCGQRTTARVEARSEGKRRFMNVFWWPLPGREHWWEETKWYCGGCEVQLASQKWGMNMNVLV